MAEQMTVCAQRVREDHRVPPIVFGAGDREAIAEAIELLWVDREHGEAAVEQCLDHCSVRDLD